MQYHLIRKPIKNIIIRFDRRGELCVSAPHWAEMSDIEKFVDSKKEWIKKREMHIKNTRIVYENGARIPYFEESYTLKLSYGKRAKITQIGEILSVEIPQTENSECVKRAVLWWYKSVAMGEIWGVIKRYESFINRPVNAIKIREMTSRWGTCHTRKGIITLSSLLFAKPKICFEYVILHELIHLIHANHGRGFHEMLLRLMPDWKYRKNLLEERI